MEIKVYIEFCRETAKLPVYSNLYDAGMDVYAAEDVVIKPGETKIIPTGLKFAIPEGFEIEVRPRSGISYKTPIRLSNSPGTIDCGYRDEFGVILTNTTPICCYSDEETFTLNTQNMSQGTYKICIGDRIAQVLLKEVPRMSFEIVPSVKNIGENRGGGFGSTGTNI